MAIRSTMADLIAKVRLMIGDPAGKCQTFDEQAIQDALDAYRLDIFPFDENGALMPRLRPSATAGLQWLDYYSLDGYFESDELLQGAGYQTLTPASAERLLDMAHWTFAASGSGQPPPVFITGKSYDVYATAADLLEYMAAKFATAYNFSTGGGISVQRGSVAPALLKQADQYRAKARPHTAQMVRHDIAGGTNSGDDARASAIGPVSSGVPFITGD